MANRNARELDHAAGPGGKLRRRDKEAKQAEGPKRLQIESRERPQRQDRQKVHDAHEAERVLLPVLGAADADAPFMV